MFSTGTANLVFVLSASLHQQMKYRTLLVFPQIRKIGQSPSCFD